jgi:hypothetical protein
MAGLFAGPVFGNGGIFGGNMPDASGNDPQGDARMAMMAQLLQGGGYSTQRQNFGQIMGQALLAGQAARMQSIKLRQARAAADLENKYKQAQIEALAMDKRRPMAVIGPDGKPQYVAQQDAIGQQPFDMSQAKDAASLQEYNRVLADYKTAGKKPPFTTFDEFLQWRAQLTPINPTVTPVAGGVAVVQPSRTGAPTVRPVSTANQENAAASGKAVATTTGTETATRIQGYINAGQAAADSMATIKRARDLLDVVDTGGFDRMKLAVTNAFGVTGADPAELSANLGHAVLSQLRATFGAQFTAAEGERLASIDAGFGKSTEGNKRLLEQTQKILDRAARRGIDAAQQSGDTFSAEEIRKSLSTDLTPATTKELTYDPVTRTFK